MNLKIIFLILLLKSTTSIFGQQILSYDQLLSKKFVAPYEQIAFEFYKDSILKNYSSKKKINISLAIIEDVSYWKVNCLKKYNININDTAAAVFSTNRIKNLNLKNDKRFKIKKFRKNKYPLVFSTMSLHFDINKSITAIIENHKDKFVAYLFKMNEEGIILDWCRDELVK